MEDKPMVREDEMAAMIQNSLRASSRLLALHRLSLRRAQLQFMALLIMTVAIVVVLEIFFLRSRGYEFRPKYARPTYYYTAEVDDYRRLGNAMFALASLIGISLLNNATPVIPLHVHLNDVLLLPDVPKSSDMLNTMGGTVYNHEEFGRRSCAYDFQTRRLYRKRSNVRLMGYYQSFKYFIDYELLIRRNFIFTDPIERLADDFLRDNVPLEWADYTRVGVHVRRGDMTERYFADFGYVTAPAEYFSRAMNYFLERHGGDLVFIVCGDDFEWTRENVRGPNVIYSRNNEAAFDMAILSRCDHVILSVGSFGWWAAWLANGTTVYYADWPRKQSQLEYHVEKWDYFPPYWIALT